MLHYRICRRVGLLGLLLATGLIGGCAIASETPYVARAGFPQARLYADKLSVNYVDGSRALRDADGSVIVEAGERLLSVGAADPLGGTRWRTFRHTFAGGKTYDIRADLADGLSVIITERSSGAPRPAYVR